MKDLGLWSTHDTDGRVVGMTTSPAVSSTHTGHVVAGLVNNALAGAVAAAAVEEATTRHTRVHFLQVLPDGLSLEDHAEVAATLFEVALAAMHGSHGLACTFETVAGYAGPTLVERSVDAAILVVGVDDDHSTVRVADYCVEHCACDVRVVLDPLASRYVAAETVRC